MFFQDDQLIQAVTQRTYLNNGLNSGQSLEAKWKLAAET